MTTAGGQRIGIEALSVYCGLAQIPVARLFEGRGLDLSRLPNLMMEQRSVGLPFEDPVTNAVNAAKPLLDRFGDGERERIELVVTASESGIDYSKSIASYVHHYLDLSRNCRVVEVKQACYAATAAVQLASGYVAGGLSPGSKALVIATDVPLVDAYAEYAEPATGAGAVALVVGDQPRVLTIDPGAFGAYSYETLDSARPTPELDIADADRSLFAYLDCLSASLADYRARVEDVDFVETFDYLAFHTPFSGLAKAAHRKLMRELTRAGPEEIERDFETRVMPSLTYPSLVGNLCAGSVYLALASLIDNTAYTGSRRVGLYSYGSGCSSEFFSGLVDEDSAAAIAGMDIARHLRRRRELAFEEYCHLLKEGVRCLVPEKHKDIDVERYADLVPAVDGRGELLALRAVRNYHRKYDWI